HALLERREALVARAPGSAFPTAALLQVGAQTFDLVLQLLQLPALVLEHPAVLAILLNDLRPRGAATEREDEQGRSGGAQPHWPRAPEWPRRLRAQHCSLSSWQSGSSFP